MSKGSGGTRGSRPAGVQGSANGADIGGISTARWEALVDSIAKDGEVDYNTWQELDNDQRDLALMEAGFTGLISEDDYEDGNLYVPHDKKTMYDIMFEVAINAAEGYDTSDETVHIGYKDGTSKTLDDIDLSPIKRTWSWNTQEAKARSLINTRDIAFILHYNASSQPMYWANGEKGMALLKKYGGFEEWKKGRGEKRRDYVQDDWI